MDQLLQLPCVGHSSQPLTHTWTRLQLPFVGHPNQPLTHGPVKTAAMCGTPQSAFNTWTSDYSCHVWTPQSAFNTWTSDYSCPGFQPVTALKFTVLSSDNICVAYHAKIFIFVAFPLMPVRVTLGFPGLCCCVHITSCKHH